VGRAIKLTPHGAEFLEAIENASRQVEQAEAVLVGRVPAARPVSVGFVHTLGVRLVPALVQRFNAIRPEVEFVFQSGNAPALDEQLVRGDLDLVFTTLPPNRPTLDSVKITDQRLVAIAPRRGPLGKLKQPIELADLAELPFVTFKRGHFLRTLTESLCLRAGFMPRIAVEGNDSSNIPGFVATGFGVALVPEDGLLTRDVVVLKTRTPIMLRPMGVVWVPGRLHANAEAFKAFVVEDARRRELGRKKVPPRGRARLTAGSGRAR
jgi:DNA-binding transcriptional LysR family regulator